MLRVCILGGQSVRGFSGTHWLSGFPESPSLGAAEDPKKLQLHQQKVGNENLGFAEVGCVFFNGNLRSERRLFSKFMVRCFATAASTVLANLFSKDL